MRRGWIIFIIFLVLICVLGYLYYFKELPQQELIDKNVNVTISAKSADNNKQIETEYLIEGVTTTYSKVGKTSKFGSIFEQLPFNQTFNIYTSNLEDQQYYIEEIELLTDGKQIYRIDFVLKSPGTIEVLKLGNLNDVDELKLSLTTNGYLKNPVLCTKWGMHIVALDININNTLFFEVDKPVQLSKYFKCYQYDKVFHNENLEIPIDYKYWEKLDNSDFIEIFISDYEFSNINNTVRYTL